MGAYLECKEVKAIFEDTKDKLSNGRRKKILLRDEIPLEILVEQEEKRTITIKCDTDISVQTLYAILSRIERLLMLFDGRFVPICVLQFGDSDSCSVAKLNEFAEHCLRNRLSYFSSVDFCQYPFNKLIEFDDVLTEELYRKWESVLEELDIVHQMYLYSLCDSGQPIDIKCAFLVELAEPLVEIVKNNKNYFPSLRPGERSTTLKDCLRAIILKYGHVVFEQEINHDFEKFLQCLVNSRKRIMHIKRRQNGIYFNGSEAILYSVKLQLLYRLVLFELLDIEQMDYYDSIERCVKRWNEWNDCLARFLNKL